ncbi:hypothetical protein CP8484711_1937B, partial [Chlamydia psittaci 84-8471/1]
ACYDA